jgi:acetyl esterase/lipase
MICPGGGYAGLAIDKEGHALARWLCARGVAAAVLKYRHGVHPHPIPLQDAQRGLRLLRSRAAQWQLDPNQMGVAGFSAGGHLAATAGTRFDLGDPSASDPIERESCRVDFLVLIYPVISLQPEIAHRSSKKRILGPSFDAALVDALSNELQVSASTGPTFLVHASDDPSVPVEHSLRFYAALRQHQVPAELHLYATGGHGFGMGRRDQPIDCWLDLLQLWMQAGKWMPAP